MPAKYKHKAAARQTSGVAKFKDDDPFEFQKPINGVKIPTATAVTDKLRKKWLLASAISSSAMNQSIPSHFPDQG